MTHYALTFSFPGRPTFTVHDVPDNRVDWWKCTFHWMAVKIREES